MTPNISDIAYASALSTENGEQRVIINGVSWQKYEAFLDLLGDDFPGVHLTYLEGTLQLMSPGRRHEFIKKSIARLLEAYLEEARIRHYPLGSTTWRKREKERGIEPDECYCIGSDKEFPDLAIEVVIASGGIDSLEVYRGLQIAEVWFWQNNQFLLYILRGEDYEQITSSELLPTLDLNLLARYVNYPESLDAVVEFRELIRQNLPKQDA